MDERGHHPGSAAGRTALVLGGGVSGLSCAVCLAEAGFRVELWARELSPHTTSDVAAAIWLPYAIQPAERVLDWARVSLERFLSLADDPASGVGLRRGRAVYGSPTRAPEWLGLVPSARPLTATELGSDQVEGWSFEVPVIEMPRYLAWLLERVRSLGVRVRERAVTSLDELPSADLLVDCAGLGARELFGDRELVPIRGQVVRLTGTAIEEFFLGEDDPAGVTYVIPRSADVVCGGTAEEGEDELTPDEALTRGILERCGRHVPGVADGRIETVAVGLRPGRTRVRLEAEHVDGRLVIHDVGHGGAGVTVSWGCAEEVLRLAREHLAG